MDRVQPLDFDQNSSERPATLIECVSVIVKGFGKDGCTSYDVMGTLQKNLPQFKPESAGPALSKLSMLQAVQVRHEYGVRRYYHVRDYDRDTDGPVIKQYEQKQARERMERREKGLAPEHQRRSREASAVVASAPVATRVAMIAVSLGTGRTELIDVQTAREIFESLKMLFEPRR